MNKSAVLGFVAGLAVLVVLLGGYYLVNALRTVEDIAVTTSQAPAPPAAAARPPAAPPTRATLPAAEADPTALHFVRRATGFDENGAVEVTITLTQQGGEPIRALGIEETLPAGWTFDGVVGGEKPDLAPTNGRGGTLEFAWFNIPTFPTSFTYLAKAAETPAPGEISGQALFRTSGAELRSSIVKTMAGRGAAPTRVAAAAEIVPAGADAADKSWAGLKLSQEVTRGFTPGGTGEIGVSLDLGTGDPVMAMAVTQQLPEGWVFDTVTGGASPAVSPDPGKGGEITFIWIQVPEFPTRFTYTVRVPETAQSLDFITGQAVYRRAGTEERTEEFVLEVPPAS